MTSRFIIYAKGKIKGSSKLSAQKATYKKTKQVNRGGDAKKSSIKKQRATKGTPHAVKNNRRASRSRGAQSNARGAKTVKNARNTSKSAAQATKAMRDDFSESRRDLKLDVNTRDDLKGLVLVIIGIILFVATIIPSSAPVTAAISTGLHLGLGIGCYLFPFVFILWGICLFLKAMKVQALRFIAGILIVLISLMGLLSLWQVNVSETDAATLFNYEVLIAGGGYAGSSLAWVFMAPFGRIIATIILIGLILAGLVLAGLSISFAFLFVKKYISLGASEKRFYKQRYQPDEQEVAEEGFSEKDFEEVSSGMQDTQAMNLDENDIPFQENIIPLGKNDIPFQGEVPLETIALDEQVNAAALSSNEDNLGINENLAGDVADDVLNSAYEAETKIKDTLDKSASKKTIVINSNNAASETFTTAASDNSSYKLPPAKMLHVSKKRKKTAPAEQKEMAAELQQTLEDFGVSAKVLGWTAGPTVSVFKIELPRGTRMSSLVNLADDIALSLAASGVRIAQIPRTSLVGVEIPNRKRETVYLGDVISEASESPLSVAIGEDTDGNKICLDLAKMPHLLVAGTTGSGKSVALNGMIMTILMRTTPDEVRMIMVDPKRVEFKPYKGIPHLYVPPVTDPKEAASALKWAVAEMERRLKVLEEVGARNISSYNQMVEDGKLANEEGISPDKIPYIVVIIDELTDLMMVAGKDVEDSIVRISQLARAVGIHLIIATQSPKSSVVTGMIKANITNRLACTVATNVESRVIIDQSGAEKLTGNGDMLFVRPEWGKPKRIQGVYVSEMEVSAVVKHLKEQGEADYHSDILQTVLSSTKGGSEPSVRAGATERDPYFWTAAEAVVNAGLGSTSMLQRRLKVGYSRAGRIMDELESLGVVGPSSGSKARDVLIETPEDLEALKVMTEQEEVQN